MNKLLDKLGLIILALFILSIMGEIVLTGF